MTRKQIRRHVQFHNGMQIGIGAFLVPMSIVLWCASFWLVRCMFSLPLNVFGFDGWGISLYIAAFAVVLLAVEGMREGMPLFELSTFTQSDFYNNFVMHTDAGFALNWYYGCPIQIMWLVSQFLFCAPRSTVLMLKAFRSLAPSDEGVIAQAAKIRRVMAESRAWMPASQFSDCGRALLLLERLDLIWVDRDGIETQVRIPPTGD